VKEARRYKYADLDDLPYDEWNQYEIFDGALHVSRRGYVPHQMALGNIAFPLHRWADEDGTGLTLPSLCTVFSEEDVAVPDLIWVTWDRVFDRTNEHGHLVVAPQLAIEVISPGVGNERRDREIKLGLYSRAGVEEYWIVDFQRRTVDVYRRTVDALELVQRLDGDARLQSSLLPGFCLDIGRIWPPEF
jgi:Uma2 family endonuclease